MGIRLLFSTLLVLSWGFNPPSAPAQPQAGNHLTGLPEDRIARADLERHVRFLASDELLGREAGTAGGDAAARYVAEHFRAAGLKPVPGAEDYFQGVPLVAQIPDPDGQITVAGTTFRQHVDLLVRSGATHEGPMPYVFVGSGEEEDYLDLDVAGKLVIARVFTHREAPSSELELAKQARAEEKGAAGFLALLGSESASVWPRLLPPWRRPTVQLLQEGETSMPTMRAFDPSEHLISALAAETEGFADLRTKGLLVDRTFSSPNVIGIIEGIDSRLSEEHVLLMAHYDHLGAGLHLRGATEADSIFNGARDNAIGTATILAAAEALAVDPPARSIIVAAFTAEEYGILGSRHYVENPPVPLENTVFGLNIDAGGLSDTSVAVLVGMGRTTADALLLEGVSAVGLGLIDDPVPEANLFERSDNVHFAMRGVPAVTISPGFHSLRDERVSRYYHQPADEVDDDFDFAYLQRFARAYTGAARFVADAVETPRWAAGDPYEEAWKRLYLSTPGAQP